MVIEVADYQALRNFARERRENLLQVLLFFRVFPVFRGQKLPARSLLLPALIETFLIESEDQIDRQLIESFVFQPFRGKLSAIELLI